MCLVRYAPNTLPVDSQVNSGLLDYEMNAHCTSQWTVYVPD